MDNNDILNLISTKFGDQSKELNRQLLAFTDDAQKFMTEDEFFGIINDKINNFNELQYSNVFNRIFGGKLDFESIQQVMKAVNDELNTEGTKNIDRLKITRKINHHVQEILRPGTEIFDPVVVRLVYKIKDNQIWAPDIQDDRYSTVDGPEYTAGIPIRFDIDENGGQFVPNYHLREIMHKIVVGTATEDEIVEFINMENNFGEILVTEGDIDDENTNYPNVELVETENDDAFIRLPVKFVDEDKTEIINRSIIITDMLGDEKSPNSIVESIDDIKVEKIK